jgi:hypothetical protein
MTALGASMRTRKGPSAEKFYRRIKEQQGNETKTKEDSLLQDKRTSRPEAVVNRRQRGVCFMTNAKG